MMLEMIGFSSDSEVWAGLVAREILAHHLSKSAGTLGHAQTPGIDTRCL